MPVERGGREFMPTSGRLPSFPFVASGKEELIPLPFGSQAEDARPGFRPTQCGKTRSFAMKVVPAEPGLTTSARRGLSF